jgi:uncharacterized protein YhaN
VRIDELSLQAFGPYTQVKLTLPGPFTLIHGPNEAGKSSLMRAITALLFGIPERTRDNFRHDYGQLRIGATLSRAGGETLTVVRRKGKTATLLDASGRPLDERSLAQFCGPLDESTFTTLFCLDHERLRQGGINLLAGGGEVGHSLFEAGTGLVGLKNALQQIEKEARELFRPQGSQPVINRALSRHAEARKRVRDSALRGDDWKKGYQAVEDARRELSECQAASHQVQRELERLGRITRNLPLLGRLARATDELAGLATVPLLPDDAASRRASAEAELHTRTARMEALDATLARLQQALAATEVDERVLAGSADIEALFADLGGWRHAAQDLPQRVQKRDHFRTAVALKRASLPPAALEPVDAGRLRKLILAHGPLASKVEELEAQARELDAAAHRDREHLTRAAVRIDTDPMRAGLDWVRALGPVEDRLREARTELDLLQASTSAALGSLGWWQGDAGAFERLVLPTKERIEAAEQELAEVAAADQRLASTLASKRMEGQQLATERAALEAAGEVPTAARVTEARLARQMVWNEMKAVYVEGRPSAGRPLWSDHETATREADRLVDALHTDVQRVTEYTMLGRRLDRIEAELVELQGQETAGRARRDQLEATWQTHWSTCLAAPRQPREGLAWLNRREELLRALQQARRLAGTVATLASQVREGEDLLARLFPDEHGPLSVRLAAAARRCDQAEARNLARREVEQRLEEREQALSVARQRGEAARQKEQQWQVAWTAALGPWGETSPAEVEGMLSRREELAAADASLSEEQKRIDGINQRLAAFTRRAAELTSALAPTLAGQDPAAASEALYRKLGTAQRAQQSRDSMLEQVARHQEEMAACRQAWKTAEDRLAALCLAAGCRREALPQVERQSARRRLLETEAADLQSQLVELNGPDLAKVVDEARAEDRDGLPGRIASLQERLAVLDQQRQDLTQREVKLDLALRAMDGGDRAAVAAQEAQEALAEIRDGAESYIRLVAAQFFLRRAIEAWRERNQGPLLSRASALFPRLTRGSFSAIRTSFDDKDRWVLVGIREDGTEVPVDGMSEGTVDQLYLALRLGALERHLGSSEPIPLVLDDILIHFDDERAVAALEVLEAVSHHTQVLFFTHHQHLAGLAREALGSRLQTLELGGQARGGSSQEGQLNGSILSSDPSMGIGAMR